jgi:hypothetical protein
VDVSVLLVDVIVKLVPVVLAETRGYPTVPPAVFKVKNISVFGPTRSSATTKTPATKAPDVPKPAKDALSWTLLADNDDCARLIYNYIRK